MLAQDHARSIMRELNALSGNEGADSWIRFAVSNLNAFSGKTVFVAQPVGGSVLFPNFLRARGFAGCTAAQGLVL